MRGAAHGIDNRTRFSGGLYRLWACRHSPSKTFQLLIYLAHNVQRVCNERVQHVISRIMTLLCTQTRVTTPGTTLSGTAAATPPEAIRGRGGSLASPTVPDTAGEKGTRGKRRKWIARVFLRETATEGGGRGGGKRGAKSWENDPDYVPHGIDRRSTENNEPRPSLTRRRLTKCENRRHNWSSVLSINVRNNGRRSRARGRQRKARNQGLKSEAKKNDIFNDGRKETKIGELRGKSFSRRNLFEKQRIRHAVQDVPALADHLIIE